MGWGARTTESVAGGADSSRYNLLPGETAHVQVAYISATTDRMLVRILATNEDTPGVAQLDTIALLEFRLTVGQALTFIIADVHAFVVSIDNDSGAESITASVRVRLDTVDLTTAV